MDSAIATEEPSATRLPVDACLDSHVHEATRSGDILPTYYEALAQALGPMHWWPARTPFEVIVGAILTQNTAWQNVEMAIANLRHERLLTPRAIERVSTQRLA